ncbi:hypothetical protein L6R52_06275 [Myxococcota bacterium]|nr:hypothetical protein [Myxococcota bacterium]
MHKFIAATLALFALAGCTAEPDAIVTVTCGLKFYASEPPGWRVEWSRPMQVEVYGDNFEELEGWAYYGDHRVCDFDVEWVRVRTSSTAR